MQILRSDEFAREVKRLARKHRLIYDDIELFLQALENGERPGYQLKGVGGRPNPLGKAAQPIGEDRRERRVSRHLLFRRGADSLVVH